MTYCENAALREEMYRAYATRALLIKVQMQANGITPRLLKKS